MHSSLFGGSRTRAGCKAEVYYGAEYSHENPFRYSRSRHCDLLLVMLARSPVMLPIPGTSRVEHLEENVAAAALKIDANKMQELDRMARAG